MVDRIPPGTRDVLPEEMRELRRIESSLLEVFAQRGYGEVRTPLIEYGNVLDKGAPSPGETIRFLDENGELLALRNDMTIPIARLVATRLTEVPPPWRLCYSVNSLRPVAAKRGELREFGQVGIELIGLDDGDPVAEVVTVLEAGLASLGLDRAVVGVGDSGLVTDLLTDYGVGAELVAEAAGLLAAGELVELEKALVERAELESGQVDSVMDVLRLRGTPEVLERAAQAAGPGLGRAIERLTETVRQVRASGVGLEIVIDLGLARDQTYYSGAILEVYEPSVGRTIGGGGRYDGLVQSFGLDETAAGITLYVERIHSAQLEEGLR